MQMPKPYLHVKMQIITGFKIMPSGIFVSDVLWVFVFIHLYSGCLDAKYITPSFDLF